MKKVASKPELGPLYWIKTDDQERIKAAWKDKETFKSIPAWKDFEIINLPKATPIMKKND